MSKLYKVNEIFYSIQGEGIRYGFPYIFVRFAECNLKCGFCDTEFESFIEMTGEDILNRCNELTQDNHCRNVSFCGGEPLLQLDTELVELFKGWFKHVETNGTRPVPGGIDWVVMSPKVAEHAVVPTKVNELKYVRSYGQGIPKPKSKADHYLISPLFEGDRTDENTMKWCQKLVLDNPGWRLTIQHHKQNFGVIR